MWDEGGLTHSIKCKHRRIIYEFDIKSTDFEQWIAGAVACSVLFCSVVRRNEFRYKLEYFSCAQVCLDFLAYLFIYLIHFRLVILVFWHSICTFALASRTIVVVVVRFSRTFCTKFLGLACLLICLFVYLLVVWSDAIARLYTHCSGDMLFIYK